MGGSKYLSAYLLAVLGGKAKPSAADVKAILDAGGCTVEDDKLKEVMKRIESSDKSVHEIILEGSGKFAASGGGGGGGGGGAAAGAAAAGAAPAASAAKAVVEEEEEEEAMEFDLFG